MEDRLSECPMCGAEAYDTLGHFTSCSNRQCKLASILFKRQEWNTRATDPLIDEIAKKVADHYEKDMLLEKMVDALEDLTERANRGREWLRTGPSGSGGNWGIFDTTIAEQALQEYREMKDQHK